jgi:CBS domain-containing protein
MKRSSEHQEEAVARLPVQIRRTELGSGETAEACSIRCPLSEGSVPLEHCLNCERYAATVSNSDGLPSLLCRVPAQAVEVADGSGDLSERLERTPVSTVMTAAVTCVDGELDLNEVASVLERARVHAAPVVEDQGVLLGVVSKSDLVRGRSSDDGDEDAAGRFPPDCIGLLVEDVMTMDVVKLGESASLGEAARLFAQHGVHRIPIVSRGDVVVGILSVIDLVRWIAGARSSPMPR